MTKGEKPRSEPEIIPPDREGQRTEHGTSRARVFTEMHGTERVYIATPGPLGVILTILMTAILFMVMLALLLGALLFWLPLIIFFIAGAIITGFLRAYFRRAP
jgi:hypothetical protein